MLIGGRKKGGKIMNKAIRIAVYCALIISGALWPIASDSGNSTSVIIPEGYYDWSLPIYLVIVGVALAFIEILIDFIVEFNKDNLKDNMKKIFDLIILVSLIIGTFILSIKLIIHNTAWLAMFTRITLAILIIVTIIMTVINFIIGFKPNKNSD